MIDDDTLKARLRMIELFLRTATSSDLPNWERHWPDDSERVSDMCYDSDALPWRRIHNKTINIQTINACQLNCSFCRGSIDKNVLRELSKGTMSLQMFKGIVDQCIQYGIIHYELTPSIGEPFLDKTIFEKLDYIESCKAVKTFQIATNLLSLDDRKIKRLLQYKKLRLEISVYGYSSQEYKQITGRDCFETFVQALKKLYMYNETYNAGCLVKFHMRGSQPYRVSSSMGIVHYLLSLMISQKNVRLTNTGLKNYNRGGSIPYNTLENEHTPVHKKGICPLAYTGAILTNGDFTFCGFNDIYRAGVIGNVLQTPLSAIYNDSTYVKLIDGQREDIYTGICTNCNERYE